MARESGSGKAHLAMRPAGLAGRLFGVVMEKCNAGAYEQAYALAAPRPGEALLEIGFGTGRLVELLLERVPDVRVAGVDPTATMVDVARGRRAVVRARDRADLRCGDASRLPWPDASFDAAFALHCFQFWADPVADAREVLRTLRPGGRLVVILREHGARPPDWLPNPLSRTGDELAAARACFEQAGYALDAGPARGAIVARKPR